MDNPLPDERLSQILTTWSAVIQAHRGPVDAVGEARRRLLQRYGSAAYRYLLGATRDPDVADDLFQEFALRLVRGDFRGADSERGRFRDFLRTALSHLVDDHWRRRRAARLSDPDDLPDVAAWPEDESDRRFLAIWRAELIDRVWARLKEFEGRTGRPHYTLLRFRTEHPEVRSPEMAEQLSRQLGRRLTAPWVRKHLFRARERFTDLLLTEVAQTLDSPALEALEQEVIDLGLHDYCRSALDRRRRGP